MCEIKRAIFDKIFIDREVVQEASACLVFEMSTWVKERTVRRWYSLRRTGEDFNKAKDVVLNQINSCFSIPNSFLRFGIGSRKQIFYNGEFDPGSG